MENFEEVLTDRLRLRRVREDDWVVFRRMDADEEVMATLGGIRSTNKTREYTSKQVEHWDEHGFGWWIALDTVTSDVVGRGGVRLIELDGQPEAEVGYALHSQFWDRGLATELAAAAVRVGLQVVRLPRLVGITLPDNTASQHVLEKVGFKEVGETIYQDISCKLFEIPCSASDPDV